VRNVLGDSVTVVNQVHDLDPNINLAVECAGHSALAHYGPALLLAGLDLISISSGALADETTEQALQKASLQGSAQLQVLSGAIGGMDALTAARIGGLDSVVYRGRKPPAGWRGSAAEESLDLDNVDSAITHFTGSSREAAVKFPKNANVAATIALAGIGMDATLVELIVDPSISTNRHEIEAAGNFGRLSFSIEGYALESNPRSSALTAMSVVAAIEKRQSIIRID
jgi:aspartate dehydrogenase